MVFEDYPGALEAGDDGEVGGDSVNASEERELSFAFRGRLVDRANRLADALDRLRSGEYGTCEVCGDRIAPTWLRAPRARTERCAAAQQRGDQQGRERGCHCASFIPGLRGRSARA